MRSAHAFARLRPVFAIFCALLSTVACSNKPGVVRVARILIDAPRELDDASATRESIRAGVRAKIAGSNRVELVEHTRQATHLLRLRIEPVTDVPVFDKAAAAAALEQDPEPAEMRRVRPVVVELKPTGQLTGYEAVGRGPSDSEVLSATLAGFEDAWRVLQRLRRIDVLDTDDLIAKMHDEDVRVRDFVIQRAGDRQLVEAVPALLRRMEQETHPQLVLRAVGSLVSIGDERAVAPLIDLTYQRSATFVLQIVFAVSGIGGRTAEGFLVTLAGGHPDEEVSRGAKQALAEMQRRRKR